jgi:single stranded DNA-binding protein
VLEGRAVLSLATKSSWKPKDSDRWQSRTDWHRIVAWFPLAEVARTLAKGDHVIFQGELRTNQYERDLQVNGGDVVTVTIKTSEVRARDIIKLAAKAKADMPKPSLPSGSLATPAPSPESGFSFASSSPNPLSLAYERVRSSSVVNGLR